MHTVRLSHTQLKRKKRKGQDYPTHWETISGKQAKLGLVCASCHVTFRERDQYYVDRHLECVARDRRKARLAKQRIERKT